MMTIAKLRTLKDRTCVRKTALLFHEQALAARRGEATNRPYIDGLRSLFCGPQFRSVLDPQQRERLERLSARLTDASPENLPVVCEDIHQFLLSVLGSEPSDWDFVDDEGSLDRGRRVVLPHILILDRIRSPFNVGSVFRSGDSFGVAEIWLVEGTADVHHPRCQKTARGCTQTIDYRTMEEKQVIEELQARSLPLFALELGGRALDSFPFPSSGAGVIGSEEFGVSPALLSYADGSLGRVSIPLGGTKGSLNVSVATGIMLQRWFASCH